jgi:hypothetical protein
MAEARNIEGSAFKNGSATLMARVVGANGANILGSEVAAIHYSIYLLDDQDPDRRVTVAGHDDVALTPGAVVFDSLRTDALWTIDSVGYNFCHILDVSAYPAFSIAGRRYLVEYRIAPNAGQIILVRFRINVI